MAWLITTLIILSLQFFLILELHSAAVERYAVSQHYQDQLDQDGFESYKQSNLVDQAYLASSPFKYTTSEQVEHALHLHYGSNASLTAQRTIATVILLLFFFPKQTEKFRLQFLTYQSLRFRCSTLAKKL